jgi:hypothetical protein
LPVILNTDDLKVEHFDILPELITFIFPTYTYKPNNKKHLGVFEVKGDLVNSFGKATFSFKLNVFNELPKFEKKLENVIVRLGSEYYNDITISTIKDPHGDVSKVKIKTFERGKTSLPPFLIFD